MPRDKTIRRYCRVNNLTTHTLAISDKWVDSTEFNSRKKSATRAHLECGNQVGRCGRSERDHYPKCPRHPLSSAWECARAAMGARE